MFVDSIYIIPLQIIEYGKLHKNNKDFYFEKQEDIFGTYMTYDDNDIRKLIDDVKKIED